MNPNLILSRAAAYRPKPFLFLTTDREEDLTVEKISSGLRSLRDAGFGGFVLFNKPPGGFNEDDFLSEKWFAVVRRFAEQSRALGLEMWINDDYDCPVGNAGGKIKKRAPHLNARHVVPDRENGYRVLQANWGFPGFEEKESAALFREIVYEAYKAHVGEFFGDPIAGFFSDADNRRVDYTVLFDENSPMRDYFPWSSDFEKTFFDAYGYNIEPYMPDIFKRMDIPQAADYWEHAGRLYAAWFGTNAAWLHDNGLLYTGHTSDSSPYLYAESARSSCLTEGRFSEIGRQFDYPGTDHELLSLDSARPTLNTGWWYVPEAVWGEALPEKMPCFTDLSRDLRAKQAASTAFLYDKKRVMCEMFAATNFGVSPTELLRIAAYQIMQGVNFIVPHAWHYLFYGELKYFAPPDFSPAGTLYRAMPQINERLTELCELSSRSRLVCDIALLDPTDFVWRNAFDSAAYFAAFSALNRLPYGFAVCDEKNLLEKSLGIKAVVAAGIDLPARRRKALEERGYAVISGAELDRLPAILDECPVSYSGEGTPHFMRRRFDDGSEICFIANIESELPIRGVLNVFGREENIQLFPGEIVYAVPEETRFGRLCGGGATLLRIPAEADCGFDRPNVIPMERFLVGGRTVTKTDPAKRIDFPFFCSGPVAECSVFVPVCDGVNVRAVALDGKMLKKTEKAFAPFTADLCAVYRTGNLTVGAHCLSIEKDGAFGQDAQVLLRGDFDVRIKTDGTKFALVRSQYNLRLYIPENAEITLSPRRTKLKTGLSAAKQGQPFYSGEILYEFTVETVPGRRYRLTVPAARDIMTVRSVGADAVNHTIVIPPYTYEFTAKTDKTAVRLSVLTSCANTLECYAEQSGILKPEPGTEEEE